MSDRSRTQDILSNILAQQTLVNTNLLSGITVTVEIPNYISGQAGRIIYVSSAAGAGEGDGTSLADAYETIEEALDDADTTQICDLILIFDDPGGEGYDINRNGANSTWDTPMIIIGVGRHQVRVVNNFVGAPHVMRFENAVYISRISVWVDDDQDNDGIVIEGGHADGSEIFNCDFQFLNAGAAHYGIVLDDVERCRINRCHFYINGTAPGECGGINVNEGLRNDIRDNIFDGNHPVATGGYGVHFSTDGGACRQNYVMNNLFVGCDVGVLEDLNCNRNGVIGNTFKSCIADVTDNGANNYEISSVTQV
jgi:hypothetical protein